MPKVHLRRPRLTYSACGPFTKRKERIQKVKRTWYSQYVYQNKLDKACFLYDMTYGDIQLTCNIQHLILPKKQNMMDIKGVLLQWFTNSLIKKLLRAVLKNVNISNKESIEELQKPIIRKFKKRKVHSPFIYNIWAAYLGDMQLCN